MLVFPQLTTGGSALYPVRKTLVQRTVLNNLDDGHVDLYSDPPGGLTLWEFAGRGLTRAEWNSIEALFEQTSGMWGAFTFLDPVGNLFARSEILSDPLWAKDTLVQLSLGIGDPLGTTRAAQITNTAQTAAGVSQALAVPGNFHYCFSGWFRATTATSAVLSITAGSGVLATTVNLNSQWQRALVSGNPNQAAAASASFRFQIAAGASIQVFGLQAEAQLAPSDYRSTGTRNGVYTKARFASDEGTGRAQAIDVHDTVIRVVSTEK